MNFFLVIQTAAMLVVFIYSTIGKKLFGLIYILVWTRSNLEPFTYLGFGQDPFAKKNCPWQNCYLVADHLYFNNTLDYDVLLFNALELRFPTFRFPPNRSEVQLYVLVGLEPSAHCRIPTNFNSFFNLTWTYKLNSDVPYPYIAVRNNRSEVIGPKINMQWIDVNKMLPTSEDVVSKLKGKSIAAAWITSNCKTINRRLEFAINLSSELSKYGHYVDFYGACGNYTCEKIPGHRNGDISGCSHKIQSDYYFYFAFENSFCEDYVTEKLLHGLKNFAVPVVYGGANYSRHVCNDYNRYKDSGYGNLLDHLRI